MKKTAFSVTLSAFLIIASGCVSKHNARKKTPEKFIVLGTVLEKQDYCGGAAPSPDRMNPKPEPVKNFTLYIRNGTENNPAEPIIDSVITNEEGQFKIELPAGNYCFVEKWKTLPYSVPLNDPFTTYDTACCRKQYRTPDFQIQLKENVSNVSITFRRYCVWNKPCSDYNGPLPPSAPPKNRGGMQPGHQE